MSEKTNAEKLRIKMGDRVLTLNAPEGYADLMGDLPSGTTLETDPSRGGPFDVMHLFVRSRAEADTNSETAMSAVKDGGILWVSYPKTKGVDINRDRGFDALVRAEWEGVAQVSLSDKWSALRFKPSADVKRKTRC